MLSEPLHQLLGQLFAMGIVHDDLCSTLPQFERDRTSDTPTSASDNNHSTFQCCHAFRLLSKCEPKDSPGNFPPKRGKTHTRYIFLMKAILVPRSTVWIAAL